MKDFASLPDYDIILVDTMNLAARNYYGLRQLSWEGKPTGMLFGIARFALTTQKMYPKARIIFLWEGVNSKRQSLHSFYKSYRKRDTDFRNQIGEIEPFLLNLEVDQMYHIGLEADDLAGYITSVSEVSDNILLVTTDEDWFQFMKSDRIDLQRRDNIETYDDIQASLGFPPEKMGMWKILKGDKTDDILGIRNFPSAAARLMVNRCSDYKQFRDFPLSRHNPSWIKWENEIRTNWHSIIERNAELILFHPDWIETSQIVCKKGVYNRKAVIKALEDRGMNSLVKEVR